MKKLRRKGFALILVIAIISVFGLEMFILAGGSNIMLFQSDSAYLQAVERNLVASGLAWAKKNIPDAKKEIFDKTIELDITDMSIRKASLSVMISTPANKQNEVQINTSCSRARQTSGHSYRYRIEL